MFYFIRSDPKGCFTVTARPPPAAIVYPEIALTVDQKVKLVDQRLPSNSYKFPAARVYMPSLLKSNLQKAIRRRYIEEAYVTAKHFLAQDASELLRRLPIIMCEDTMLNPGLFMEIIWLMAAVSKGYRLCAADCQLVMDFIGACLSAPSRYNILATATTEADMSDPLQLAFALRIAYGGMKFDTDFMGRLLERLAAGHAGDLPYHLDFIHADYESIGAFDIERHLLPEAVDFHCFPSILEIGVDKQVIWYNRSARNIRPFTGLAAEEGSAREATGAAEWPLSDTAAAALDEFVERTVAGLRGRVPAAPAAKQIHLTGFVRRGGKL
jgi:hypothetical protein